MLVMYRRTEKSNLRYTRLIPFRVSRVSGAHLRGFAEVNVLPLVPSKDCNRQISRWKLQTARYSLVTPTCTWNLLIYLSRYLDQETVK